MSFVTSGSFVARGSTYRQPRSRRYRRGPPRRLEYPRRSGLLCSSSALPRSGAFVSEGRANACAPEGPRRAAATPETLMPTTHAARSRPGTTRCARCALERGMRRSCESVSRLAARRCVSSATPSPRLSFDPSTPASNASLKARRRRRSSWIPRVSVTRPRLGRADETPRAPEPRELPRTRTTRSRKEHSSRRPCLLRVRASSASRDFVVVGLAPAGAPSGGRIRCSPTSPPLDAHHRRAQERFPPRRPSCPSRP